MRKPETVWDRQATLVAVERAEAGRNQAGPSCDVRDSVFLSLQRGQIIMEYFLLFALIGLLTVVGLTTFDTQVRETLRVFFLKAANVLGN